MIIVEGGDNCGKSTLIKQLIALDPALRLIHRDRFNPKANETIGTTHLRALTPPDNDFRRHAYSLADRFFASEIIYGELFRDGARFTESESLAIRSIMYSYKTVIVWCDPPDESVLTNWQKRDQLYDNPILIARAYRERMHRIFKGFTMFSYDWTAPDAELKRERYIDYHRRYLEPYFPEFLS